jgi:hypothetical protein
VENSLIEWRDQFDGANGLSDPLLEISALAEATNKDNGLDDIIDTLHAGDLVFDELDDFIDDGIKGRLHVFDADGNTATRNPSSGIVLSAGGGEVPFLERIDCRRELTLCLNQS